MNRAISIPYCPLVLAVLVVSAGCSEARYPVAGRVLVKGVPLKGKDGTVVLKPDANQGNRSTTPALGMLDRDGGYSVQTNGQSGAVPGWYKVIIIATNPDANPNEEARRVINARYEKEATTPLTLEVVTNPAEGKYDISLLP